MVFVIESAATNRSFRRFLGTPGKDGHFQIKLKTHAVSTVAVYSCESVNRQRQVPGGRVTAFLRESII